MRRTNDSIRRVARFFLREGITVIKARAYTCTHAHHAHTHAYQLLRNLTIVRAEVPGFVIQSQRSLGVAPLLAEPVTEKEKRKVSY